MVTESPSFQLTVRIMADLGEQEVREVRAALAGSGAADVLRKKEGRSETYWRIDMGRAGRPETLLRKLTDLGEDVPRTIARAVQGQEDAVFLSLCQEIDDVDDPQQKGVWFSAEDVRWAALAGASIDIDQYIYAD